MARLLPRLGPSLFFLAGLPNFLPSILVKKRVVENTIREFQNLLRDGIRMVLDGSGSFGELKPLLQMFLGNLTTLMGANLASPFQRRLEAAEKDIQELFVLRSENLLALASERARSALKEQEQSLEAIMAEESALSKEVERINVEGKKVGEEHQKASATVATLAQPILEAKQTIAELQAFLAAKEPVYEEAAKQLEELENQQQLIVAEFEEKNKALKAARAELINTVSLTEEDIRKQILTSLEKENQKAIRDAESRLKRF